ncbi:MAG: VWA domain-containing protein [Candidatus Coatesbacteria bacterium]|nr:VWA domain-containing protein [Candidatus Coatesbacteria bacterium]
MRRALVSLFSILILLFAVGSGLCQGLIFVPEQETGVPQPLSTKTLKVTFDATESLATTKIEQTFFNPTDRTLEGQLIFPLPKGAAVSKFAIWAGNKKLMAKVLSQRDAKRIYDDIVRKMRDPALLQYVGRGMFEARVYPIEPKSTKRIELEYSCVLEAENDVVNYVFPLDSFAVTHLPLMSFVLVGKVKSERPLKNIYSPSHSIALTRLSDTEASVSIESNDLRADKDFSLYYTLSRDDVGINLMSHKDGDDGYFLLLAAPKYASDRRSPPPKEVVFVLDISGSMQGAKIEQARSAAKHIVSNLGGDDYFNIIVFNDQVRKFKSAQVRATKPDVKEAIEFLNRLEAAGGTNIDGALGEAVATLKPSNMPRMVIFLTDGQPTVGVTDTQQILDNIKTKNTGSVRIYAFGVGFDVGADLLDGIVRDSRGTVSYVIKDEQLERVISSFYDKVAYPVLSDVSIEISGVETFETYPSTLPDFFKGTQLVLFGRYSGGGPASVALSGRVSDRAKSYKQDVSFARGPGEYDFIPRLWALRRVGFLLDEIRRKGENTELVNECVRLGTKYAIVTPYTSQLVTEDDGVRPLPVWWNEERSGVQPVPSSRRPDATRLSGNAYVQAAAAAPASASEPKDKIAGSMVIQELSQATAEKSQFTGTRKVIGDKTFIFKDDCWTDTAIQKSRLASPDTVIEFFSEAYFKIIDDDEKLARYFSAGQCVIVLYKSRIIRVTGAPPQQAKP